MGDVIAYGGIAVGLGLMAWPIARRIWRLAATHETAMLARTIESLAVAAHAAYAMDEGRVAQDLLVGLRARVDLLGLDAATDAQPDLGPRGVFQPDGTYAVPGGAVWDFGGGGEDDAGARA